MANRTSALPRIAIVGTGLIGASIGLRLRGSTAGRYEVVGLDVDRAQLKAAKRIGAIDREATSLEEGLEGAGLVIVATPILATRRLFRDMASYLEEGAIVTDTLSTKGQVLRWAEEFLPPSVHFVGGHPMAGKEQAGAEHASSDLFEGATWAIVPSPRADERAVQTVVGMVEALGAVPAYFDADEHDRLAAAVSHMPLFLSVTLFRLLRDSPSWEDAALLAGPGFRDLTRLASGDPVLAQGLLRTNRDAIVHWIDRFQSELRRIRDLLSDIEQEEEVGKLLAATKVDRDTFIENPPRRDASRAAGPTPPSTSDALGQFIAGGLYQRIKELTSREPQIRIDERRLRRELGIDDDDSQA